MSFHCLPHTAIKSTHNLSQRNLLISYHLAYTAEPINPCDY